VKYKKGKWRDSSTLLLTSNRGLVCSGIISYASYFSLYLRAIIKVSDGWRYASYLGGVLLLGTKAFAEFCENTQTSSSIFDGYTFLQHWIWTLFESITSYIVLESRKEGILSMCSILKCCFSMLSLVSCFCFCILKIRIRR